MSYIAFLGGPTRARPGWHIECLAMIGRHFGRFIDNHGGGQDLIFPHHENEIARGTCAGPGETYFRYWIHYGFVTIDGAKMSKSLGNVRLVHELLDDVPGEAIRFALLSAHYRSSIHVSDRSLRYARHGLNRLYGAMREPSNVEPSDEGGRLTSVLTALENNLNTTVAIAELFALAKAAFKATRSEERAAIKASMIDASNLLGLLNNDPKIWFTSTNDNDPELPLIKRLIADLEAARVAGDFGVADRLRSVLLTMGVQLDDSPDGTYWRRTA